MNIALWIVAGLLAAVYLAAGSVKLLKPKEELAEQMKWTKDVSARTVHGVGAIEVLGALGVVLPGALPRSDGARPRGSSRTRVGPSGRR